MSSHSPGPSPSHSSSSILDTKEVTLALLRKKGLIPKEPVTIRAGKCSAHLYILNIQGKKRWVTYQCFREGCRHFATLDNIRNRKAECTECGRHFLIQIEHVIKDGDSEILEERLYNKITCGCNFTELSESILEKLREELSKKEDDLEWTKEK